MGSCGAFYGVCGDGDWNGVVMGLSGDRMPLTEVLEVYPDVVMDEVMGCYVKTRTHLGEWWE